MQMELNQEHGMKLGFHTDAFNSAYWSFEKCLAWATQNNVHYIECGLIDGVSWIHGLGYQPHVALYEDPMLLRRKMERYGIQFSQVDAAFPLSGEDGPLRGVPYVMKAIAWAAQVGCPCVDTTDGLHKPEGLSDRESLTMMKRSYQQIMRVAEAHEIIVNVEPHGYFTTNPEAMAEILAFVDSPLLRIAVSHCALGAGVNAGNIRECLMILKGQGYKGALSIECEGQAGPLIEQSMAWLRQTLKDLGIHEL
jgi:inosose dehydratase